MPQRTRIIALPGDDLLQRVEGGLEHPLADLLGEGGFPVGGAVELGPPLGEGAAAVGERLSAHSVDWECEFEHLLDRTGLDRVIVLADQATDTESIEARFARQWGTTLAADSPNRYTERPTVRFLHVVESQSSRDLEALLVLLLGTAGKTDVPDAHEPLTLRAQPVV